MKNKLFKKGKNNYKKQIRQVRKKLIKLSKEWQAYDYGFTVDLFITCLEAMANYYNQKDNVHAGELPDHDRFEGLTKALDLYKAYLDNLWEENEKEYWKKFWEYIGEEMLYWWD